MTDNGGFGIYAPKILMPAEGTDLEKWATIACDQYTSDPGYWQKAEELIGDAPSTLDLQMPEAWLGEAGKGHEGHEAAIPRKMKEYLENGTLREIPEGFVFIKRETSSGTRRGLLALADMDRFDYRPGSKALIRASEETVESRLPVRVEIRKTAPLEMPHAMLLFRDPKDMLMGSLEVLTRNRRPLYDFPLMLGGGRIRGWLLQTIRDWNVVADIFNILLAKAEDGMLFAVGDGNHSLAAAKLCREQEKARGISSDKRFALVELVNLYDPALQFLPIHRLIKDGQVIDYIHGEEECRALAEKLGCEADIRLPYPREQLFPDIIKNGALPKKSFSIGRASDKRYYLECRRL